MFQSILIITLAIGISYSKEATRTYDIKDNMKINIQKINSESKYSMAVNQQMVLDYEVDMNAYSIQLDEILPGGKLKSQETIQRSEKEGDHQDKMEFNLPNGCTAYKRDFFIDKLVDFESDQYSISDLIVLPLAKKIYVLTQNYEIVQGEFKLDIQPDGNIRIKGNRLHLTLHQVIKKNFKQIAGKQTVSDSRIFGFVTDKEENAYIFTKYGGIMFNTQISFDDEKFKFEMTPFSEDVFINDILTYKDYVFILVEQQGVDIYKVQPSKSVTRISYLKQTLQKAIGEGKQMDIIKVALNNDVLVVLDKYNGLFFFDASDPENITKLIMEIRLKNVVSFDYRGNTMILVFKSQQEDKVWELFIDYNKATYFVNRVYLDDITYSDVRMDSHFAILMSDSAHRIISHSVYKEFSVASLWQKHRYFSQLNLEFLIMLTYDKEEQRFYVDQRSYNEKNILNEHKYSFLLGAGGTRFSVQQVQEMHTQIRCVADKAVEKRYQISINSTSCDLQNGTTIGVGNGIHSGQNDDYSRNEINPFQQCQRVFNMSFVARSTLVETDNIGLVAGVLIGTLFFIMFVGCFLLISYRQAKLRKLEAKKRWEAITYQQNMSNAASDQPDDETQAEKNMQSEGQQQESENSTQNVNKKKGSNFQIDDDDNNINYGVQDEEEEKQDNNA